MDAITDPLQIALLVTLPLIAGTVLGAFFGSRYQRAKGSSELERIRGVEALERASLQERVTARDATVAELREAHTTLLSTVDELRTQNTSFQAHTAELSEKLRSAAEEQTRLAQIQEQFTAAFRALSADALKSNNQMFMDLAQTTFNRLQEGAKGDLEKRQSAITEMVKPVRESLEKFDTKIQELEKARVGAYEGLTTQVRSLLETQTALRSETGKLVKALGTPQVRGRWGEIQLRRVVEIAGMVAHCDFTEQHSTTTEEGRLRPDMVVHLPAGKSIVVDSKAVMDAYFEAVQAQDEATRQAKLQDHARLLREHARKLGEKSYWDQFDAAPDFVVLFVPGESFFSAALEQSPELIEQAVAERVLIATPTTLIALLKTVAYSWRQERIAENATEISILGKELYKRIGDVAGNFGTLGGALNKAVEHYNKAIYNLESRVLTSARKFRELDSAGNEEELEAPKQIESSVRQIQSEELLGIKEIPS
jgi:DNA recombination protein RmuC